MSDQAVVNFAPEPYSVELRDIAAATIDEDQALVEVSAIGVCGSDLHMWAAPPAGRCGIPSYWGTSSAASSAKLARG